MNCSSNRESHGNQNIQSRLNTRNLQKKWGTGNNIDTIKGWNWRRLPNKDNASCGRNVCLQAILDHPYLKQQLEKSLTNLRSARQEDISQYMLHPQEQVLQRTTSTLDLRSGPCKALHDLWCRGPPPLVKVTKGSCDAHKDETREYT